MKAFFSNLRRDPINTLSHWQDGRFPWLLFAITSILLVLIAHNVFQIWMHMLPCEQCVYIRYGNLVMALGALIVAIKPTVVWSKIVGCAIFIYGLVYTAYCSIKLVRIHDAVHSDDPMAMFGMQGCSTEPKYHFGLPLDKWAPEWFKPTGDCGYDAPMPAEDVELSSLQQWFIELYQASDGWYLIPQWKFMDMAECCLLACVCYAVVFIAIIFAWLKRDYLSR